MDKDWPAVLWNIQRVRQVWGWLGELIRRERSYLILSEKFYCVVVQAVLLYRSETWVLTAAMMQNLE